MEKRILTLDDIKGMDSSQVTEVLRLGTESERTEMRARHSQDLFAFGVEMFGLDGVLVREEDEAYIEALVTPFLDPGARRRVHVERPRMTRKTLLGAQVLPVWLLSQKTLPGLVDRKGRPKKGRDLRILIISESRDLACRVLKTHQTIITSDTFSELYGSMRGDKWREYHYFVSTREKRSIQEPSVMAAGLDVEVTGSHWDVIIADDLVTIQNISDSGLDRTWAYYEHMTPLLDDGGVLLLYGTRYHNEDLYGRILREDKDETLWDTHITGALSSVAQADDEGELVFPEEETAYKFPISLDRENLISKYRGMDIPSFSAQYLLQVVPTQFQLFAKHHFKFIHKEDITSPVRTYFVTDTATTTRTSGCRSVIVVVQVEVSGRCAIRDYRAGHWPPASVDGRMGFIDHLFDLARKWSPESVTFEEIGLNEVFKSNIEQMMHSERCRFGLISVKGRTQTTKEHRIRGVQPKMRNQELVFDRAILEEHLNFETDFMREFLFYGSTSLDDVPDAVSDIFALDPSGLPYLLPPAHFESAGVVEEFRYPEIDEGEPFAGYH